MITNHFLGATLFSDKPDEQSSTSKSFFYSIPLHWIILYYYDPQYMGRFPEIRVPPLIIHFGRIFLSKLSSYWGSTMTSETFKLGSTIPDDHQPSNQATDFAPPPPGRVETTCFHIGASGRRPRQLSAHGARTCSKGDRNVFPPNKISMYNTTFFGG